MKKQICHAIIGCIALIIFSGCEDFITYDDPSSTTDELWWRTEANATSALATVYEAVPAAAWPTTASAKNVMMGTGLTDDGVGRQDARGAYTQYVLGIQNAAWDVGTHIWRVNYRDIRRACRFIENVDRVPMDVTVRERYKNEARALRAYYHMELLMNFGGVPIVTSPIIPKDNVLHRNTEAEVYNFVVNELKACAPNLPPSYTNADAYRMSRGVCWALISRLALYYKDYELARDAAREVINMNVFRLHPSYADLFKYSGELNNERIFINQDGSKDAWRNFAPNGVGGEPVTFPTAALVDSYETRHGSVISELSADSIDYYKKNPTYKRDLRLQSTVLFPGQTFDNHPLNPFNLSSGNRDRIGANYSTATGFWLQKYLDVRDRNAAVSARTLDFMIIRYAEVLLNYVEALVELNDWQNPDVTKYLNDIRTRAGLLKVDDPKLAGRYTGSQEEMRKLIRRERRSELAFEGVRYFDIRRWGIADVVMNGPVFGAVNPETNAPELVETRQYRPDRDYLWPIPAIEVMANPNMKQNANY